MINLLVATAFAGKLSAVSMTVEEGYALNLGCRTDTDETVVLFRITMVDSVAYTFIPEIVYSSDEPSPEEYTEKNNEYTGKFWRFLAESDVRVYDLIRSGLVVGEDLSRCRSLAGQTVKIPPGGAMTEYYVRNWDMPYNNDQHYEQAYPGLPVDLTVVEDGETYSLDHATVTFHVGGHFKKRELTKYGMAQTDSDVSCVYVDATDKPIWNYLGSCMR